MKNNLQAAACLAAVPIVAYFGLIIINKGPVDPSRALFSLFGAFGILIGTFALSLVLILRTRIVLYILPMVLSVLAFMAVMRLIS